MPKPPTCRRCNTAHWTTQVCPASKQHKIVAGLREAVAVAKGEKKPARETTYLVDHKAAQPAAPIAAPTDIAARLAELEAKEATRRRRKADAMKRWRDGVKKGKKK